MYYRFLNNSDYLSSMTKQMFDQITRGDYNNAEKLCSDAEKIAESTLIEYLSKQYNIESVLDEGRYIAGFDERCNITYPSGTHLYINGVIYKTLTVIFGRKRPLNSDYWSYLSDYSVGLHEEIYNYSQMMDYAVGDIVEYNKKYYRAIKPSGVQLFDIRIPSVEGWDIIEPKEFEFMDYEVGAVVKDNNEVYQLFSTVLLNKEVPPHLQLTNWELVTEYADTIDYSIGDACLYNGKVVVATTNVNQDTPVIDKNIVLSDPRNLAVRTQMIKIASYHLTKGQISPTNTSSGIIRDFDDAMVWLNRASKLQIAPDIPRRIKDDGEKATTWVSATLIKEDSKYGGWGGW